MGLFALVVFAALAATASDYGYAVDEATYVWVARQERLWFQELPQRGLRASFSRDALANRWHFLEPPDAARGGHSNFNLPLAMHLMNVGWLAGSRLCDELTSYRLASMALLALCAADVLRTIGGRVGPAAGVVAAFSLVLSPRIFGHGRLAATETPLSTLWLLTCLALVRTTYEEGADRRAERRRVVVVALLLSLTMSVKFTGWLLWPAVLLWLLAFRPPRWAWAAALSCALPLLVIVALTPTLWSDPFGGLARAVEAASRDPWRIPTYYLHEGYTGRLPPSSAVVLTAAATPVSVLLLAVVGVVGRLRRPYMWAVALPTLTLLAARAWGMIPTHDGERQFLPVFYGLAALAGVGFDVLLRAAQRLLRVRAGSILSAATAVVLGVAALAEPAVDLWTYRGRGLMYYNRAVGGLSGAAELGFEISYWFEGMTHDDWRRMLADLPPNARVFLRPDHPGLEDLRGWGVWREDLASVGPTDADYYLLYAKRAAYLAPDEATGRWVRTDLGAAAERGPMDKEIRFQGVRLAGLKKVRPSPPR
jgi:hypothetical protein